MPTRACCNASYFLMHCTKINLAMRHSSTSQSLAPSGPQVSCQLTREISFGWTNQGGGLARPTSQSHCLVAVWPVHASA